MHMVMPVLQEISHSRALQIAIWFAVILFVLSGLSQIPDALNRFRQPYVVLSAEAVTHEVQAGGELKAKYKLERRRICSVVLDRFIRSIPDNQVITRETVPGGATELGTFEVVNGLRLPGPDKMPPGDYALSTTVINDCPEGKHSTTTPIVRFRVLGP